MSKRIDLHKELKTFVANVYFQPPETVKLTYPCIIYNFSNDKIVYASNKVYVFDKAYEITIISKDPDNDIADKMLKKFSLINFSRRFVSENLYHDVLTLYY